MRFEGKVAAVTGGGSGIGRATAEALAAEGARVAVLDIDGDSAAATAEAIGPAALAAALDVTHAEAVAAAMDWVAATAGGFDILVTSAAIALNAPILETDAADWRRVIETNLTGTFLASRAAGRIMAAAGAGRIVHVSSVNGLRAVTGRGAYAAAKGGVEMLTKVMAAELGPLGVTVNAVAPAPVETPMIAEMHGPETREAWHRVLPIKRYGDPLEVAAAILFLASDEAAYINGHTMAVDGGFMAAGLLMGD